MIYDEIYVDQRLESCVLITGLVLYNKCMVVLYLISPEGQHVPSYICPTNIDAYVFFSCDFHQRIQNNIQKVVYAYMRN